jgi:hypothetical protein
LIVLGGGFNLYGSEGPDWIQKTSEDERDTEKITILRANVQEKVRKIQNKWQRKGKTKKEPNGKT